MANYNGVLGGGHQAISSFKRTRIVLRPNWNNVLTVDIDMFMRSAISTTDNPSSKR